MFPGRLVINGSAGQVIARGPAVRLDGGDRKSGCCIPDHISSQSGTVRLVGFFRMSSAFCRTSIGWRAVSPSLLDHSFETAADFPMPSGADGFTAPLGALVARRAGTAWGRVLRLS